MRPPSRSNLRLQAAPQTELPASKPPIAARLRAGRFFFVRSEDLQDRSLRQPILDSICDFLGLARHEFSAKVLGFEGNKGVSQRKDGAPLQTQHWPLGFSLATWSPEPLSSGPSARAFLGDKI